MSRTSRAAKICAACGREMVWRKRWERVWDEVRFCSARCRRERAGTRLGRALERAIVDLLATRRPGASICPSEAARLVRPESWRPLLESTRSAARRLAADGTIEILRQGRPVDPGRIRGPVRLRLRAR